MRLFLAVMIPQGAIDELAGILNQWQSDMPDPGVRWTKPDSLHLTVKFLGEVDYVRAGRVQDLMKPFCAGRAGFDLEISGLGAFPSESRPSVLWADVGGGSQEYQVLCREVDEALSSLQFKGDKKESRPHLTLARIKSYRGETECARFLKRKPQVALCTFPVDYLSLMRSDLSQIGSSYTEVDRFLFSKGLHARELTEETPQGEARSG